MDTRDPFDSTPALAEVVGASEDPPEWAVRFVDEGMSLQQLGDLLGITREGARQRLKKYGLTGHGIAVIRERRAQEAAQQRNNRLAEIEATQPGLRDVLFGLAADDLTRDAVMERLALFYPEISTEEMLWVAESFNVPFANHNHGESHFSDASLEGALLYLLGSHLSLQPDTPWAARHLSAEVASDVSEVLIGFGLTTSDVATVLGVIGAARKAVLEAPCTISGKEYDTLRSQLLESMGLVSAQGAMLWPPTRQTFMKRFDGWNEALTTFGLTTSRIGRPKGRILFTDADYTSAAREYLLHCKATGQKDTYRGYDDWVKVERDAGRLRPSGASARGFFGSWHDVMLAAADDFADVPAAPLAGQPRYADDAYVDALTHYIADSEAEGASATYGNYAPWTHREEAAGRYRPSASAIQKHFGSWSAGVDTARSLIDEVQET